MKINGIAAIPVLFSTLMSFTVAHDIIIRGDQWKTLTKGSEFPVLRENDRWVPGEVDKVVEKLDWYKFTVTDEIRSAALKGKGRGSTSTSQQLETLPLQMYRNKKVTCIRIWNKGKTQHTYYVTDSSKLKRWVELTIQPGDMHFLDVAKPKIWAREGGPVIDPSAPGTAAASI
jgi:hypothetical protein